MIEVVYGLRKNLGAINDLEGLVKDIGDIDGTLYFGYPIYSTIDEKNNVDAMLVSKQHGVILFHVNEEAEDTEKDRQRIVRESQEIQDILLTAVKSRLHSEKKLINKKRELAVPVTTATYCPHLDGIKHEIDGFYFFRGKKQLAKIIEEIPLLDPEYYRPLNAVLQLVTNYKPKKKRPKAVTANSRGSILKEIEKEMANLDRWQKKAALEITNGPQRIRGLAGSGKTIVLALKAAYLHSLNQDMNIVVTFNTRSLYAQLKDLIRRFTFDNIKDEPDWDKIQIMHAWGSEHQRGLYSVIAKAYERPAKNFLYAKQRFGFDNAFKGICAELLDDIQSLGEKPLFDVILVDEAQDLPSEFFRLCYRVLGKNKHIIWAYDELQNLRTERTSNKLSLDNLFGTDENGNSLVTLQNREGKPEEDIVLKVCYRNTPWALTLAHSLGFGIYREKGFVQFFDEPELWLDIGYEVISGELAYKKNVGLRRDREFIPQYFEPLFDKDDAVVFKKFDTVKDQYKWVAKQIKKDLKENELEYSDILVISPNPLTFKEDVRGLVSDLYEKDIDSHLAGITSSQDEFFIEGSVVISGIHRAKGNEAPMVYIVNSEHCFDGWELSKIRNILFTAITRSKAWVRICGVGETMDHLIEEIERLRGNDYALNFKYPTKNMIEKMRMIHRDKTDTEKKALRSLKDAVEMLQKGAISPDDIDPSLKEEIIRMLSKKDDAR